MTDNKWKAEKHEALDHDTIVRLVSSFEDFKGNVNEKFADLKADIRELRDGVANRLEILEREKADRRELDEVQNRINSLQKHVNENVETRVKHVEDWRIARKQQIEEENKKNALYFKITMSLGIIILGMCIWHLTGFSI